MRIAFVTTRIVWLAICFAVLLAGTLSWLDSGLEGWRFIDFKKAYYAGGEAVLRDGSAALWPLIESADFVNLPIVAWIFSPLVPLGLRGASLTFLVLGLASTAVTLWLTTSFAPPRSRPPIALLFALNGPLWYGLLIGNTTHFILLLFVSALLLWKRRWAYAAGILLGLAVIIKPIFLPIGVYFLWRRNWQAVFGGATMIGLALLSSMVVFGLQFNIDWYEHIVLGFAGKPMGAFNVQSLDAFLLRLRTGPELFFDWTPQTLSFELKMIRDIVVGSLSVLVVWSMWRNRRRVEPLTGAPLQAIDLLEFCLVLTLCVTISTVSWTHYYLLLLLPWSLYLAGALPLRDDRISHGLLWGSIILCSMPHTHPRVDSSWLVAISSRTVQSVWLFGGLLLLSALLRSAMACPGKTTNPWLARFLTRQFAADQMSRE